MPLKKEELQEEYAVIPPDGGWGWMVVFASFLCNYMIDGIVFTFGIFLEDIGETLNVHPTKIGIAHSIMTGFSSLAGPFTCGIVNHYGFRPVAFLGGLIAALAFLLSTFIKSIEGFILVLGVLGGIGLGMLFLPTVVVVGYYFEKWRSLASGLSMTGSAVGIITFPTIIDNLMSATKWQTKFLVIMGALIACSFLSLMYRPIKPKKVLTQNDMIVEVLSDTDSQLSKNIFPSTSTVSVDSEFLDVRPMDRDDVFLTASLYTLPVMKSDIRALSQISTRGTIARSTISMRDPSVRTIRGVKTHFRDCCATITDMLVRMLNLKLLKSPSFDLFLIGVFMAYCGLFTPFLYLKQRAKEDGIKDQTTSNIYIGLGIANVIGRVGSGIMTSIPRATPLSVSYITYALCGIATIASIFCKDIYTQFLYTGIFGLTCASMASLRVPIVVDLLGLENLTNGFGLVLLFGGVATMIGVPISGAIVEAQDSYSYAYIYAGCMFIVSAMCLLSISVLNKWKAKTNVDD